MGCSIDTDTHIDFSQVRRVLVTKLRFHGDVLLAAPVFACLKQRFPHLEVDALIYAETRDMLSDHPDIDRIFTVDRGWRHLGTTARLRHEWQLFQLLRARRHEVLIHLTEDWRGVLLKHLLGIPVAASANYARRARSLLWRRTFTHLYLPTSRRHKVEFHLDALRALGLPVPAGESELRLYRGDAVQAAVAEKMRAHGLCSGGFIQLHPGSRFLHKVWSAERMAALCDRLHQDGHVLVLTGAPTAEERQLIDRILQLTTAPAINLCGQLSLKELGELISHARCFVGVDSAPAHIAAAVGAPAVVLFGPTSAALWRPWSSRCDVVVAGLSCQPCQRKGCGGSGYSACLDAVSVQRVHEAVRARLAHGHEDA